MTPRPSPDDAARAEDVARGIHDEYNAGFVWDEDERTRNRPALKRMIADALLTFAAQAAQRAEEECAKIAVRKSCMWSVYEDQQSDEFRRGVEHGASQIATAIRAHHAAPAPEDRPPAPLDGWTPNVQR